MRWRSCCLAGPVLGAVVTVVWLAPAHAARLVTDVVPVSQEVRLRIDADTTEYTGSIRATLEVREPTRVVRLHAEGQKLDRVKLTQKGREIPVRQERGAAGLLSLTAEKPLARGPALLEISFSNAFNTKAVGLYRMVNDGNGYLFTQFEAEDARKAFPCWDEPSYKFPYRMTLEVPERHQALSNTPIERESVKGGWRTYVFEQTPPMPSYLLALSSGPLEFVAIPGMRVPSRIVTVKGQGHLTGMAIEATPRLLEALERYFDMRYPYKKLDLIAVPEYWFGAMENPGAITFADNILLLDPKTATVSQRRGLLRITAHELAHMWFGDLVTMRWWDDMWLNEAFADWMGDKMTHQVAPELKLPLAELQSIQNIMESDARPSTDAIRQPLENGNQAMHTVGLAYNKGKAVLAMFESWIGEETFRRGVNAYLRANAWKNAESSDLWAALGSVSGKDVPAAMAGYVDQQGHPLIRIEPLGDRSLRLTQQRFLNHGVKAPPLSWQVPMSIRWSDGRQIHTQAVTLRGPSATVQLEGGGRPVWVMPNADGRGYYRWIVPQPMLLTLARQSLEVMNPLERIAFLGNARALLKAGEMKGDAYLELLAELADDPEPLAASAVISGVGTAKDVFVSDDLRDAFAAYVRHALRPMATRYGFEKKPGEDESAALVRPLIFNWLGRDGRDPDALALADRAAERYMNDPKSVDPALVTNALQLHANHGDRALFDRYRQRFETAKDPGMRQRFLSALGHFEDPAIQDAALAYALEGAVRPPETFTIPFGVQLRGDRGRDKVFQWVRDRYVQLAAKLPPQFLTNLPNLADGCNAARLAAARQFFSEPVHQVDGTLKEVEQVTEKVEDCLGLRGRERAAVAAYLKRLAESGKAARGTAAP